MASVCVLSEFKPRWGSWFGLNEHDFVLNWVSEKGSGTFAEFKETWDWVRESMTEGLWSRTGSRKAWVELTDLGSLGHIEISWEGRKEWAVAPPVLTMLPNSGCRSILAGSRNRALVDVDGLRDGSGQGILHSALDEVGNSVDAEVLTQYRGNGPAAIVIAGETPADIQKVAELSGIEFTYSISEELADIFPPLHRYTEKWESFPMPQGHEIEVMDSERLRWIKVREEEPQEPGLYSVNMTKDFVHVLQIAPGKTVRASREFGVYELFRWEGRKVLQYSAARRELWVPVAARLPILQARAVTLTSGMLPRYEKRLLDDRTGEIDGLVYVNIGEHLASRIAKSLSQEGVV